MVDDTTIPQAFFQFTLTREVNFKDRAFAISVLQQGDRLMNYRQKDPKKLFNPSKFNIVLMTADGEFVHGRYGSGFTFSLLTENIVLKPGKYILMIDPMWNESTANDQLYREVLIDVYCPEPVVLDEVEDIRGMEYLAAAFKYHARTEAPEESRELYLSDHPDYGEDVLRVQDIESLPCWYGYIYTQNSSPHTLSETLRPQVEGLDVIYPTAAAGGDSPDIELAIPSQGDHIVILRRTQPECSFSLGFMTHERILSDAQMVQMAIEMDDSNKTYFG